ncbi:MAG: hypothetical protein ABI467_31430 [Kofleriaceae bacterium]
MGGLVVKYLILLLAGCELFVDVPNATLATKDASGDGRGVCIDASTCTAPTPQCDTTSHTCVECLSSPDCVTPDRPVCQAEACRGCLDDTECPASNVCLSDGSCADPARVLYAAQTGTGVACTQAAPCTFDQAVASVSATADVVKLAPGTYDRPAQLAITKNMIVTGEGATFHGTATTSFTLMFDITSAAVTFLRIHFDLGGMFGAECGMNGELHLDRVVITNGVAGAYSSACTFSVDRSLIDSVTFYGLYLINSTVTVSNTFVTNSGASSQGGIVINGSSGVIEHVTLAGDTAAMAGGQAIRCTDGNVAIRSSIIFGNGTPAVEDACLVGHSVIDPGYAGPGTDNVTMDPLYVAPATRDYHIQAGSPAVGLADPASHQTDDYDGDPRPNPAGSMADSGADEIP